MPKPESSIELELRNMRQMGCMKPRMRAAGFEGSQTSISKEQFPPYTLYTRLFWHPSEKKKHASNAWWPFPWWRQMEDCQKASNAGNVKLVIWRSHPCWTCHAFAVSWWNWTTVFVPLLKKRYSLLYIKLKWRCVHLPYIKASFKLKNS